jgi:membrane protein DedA with SNARE-associated domain
MFAWIIDFVVRGGYLGLVLLMFVENVFPPIPSELIMPLAGFSAAQGKLSIFLAILAGTAGSVGGALFWFGVGRFIGASRLKHFAAKHGRLLTLSVDEVDQAHRWFNRHGAKAVFLGRLIPTVRSLISVPAGVVNMPLKTFVMWTTLGSFAWTALLAGAGYLLQREYRLVADILDPISMLILVLILAYYSYRVWSIRR